MEPRDHGEPVTPTPTGKGRKRAETNTDCPAPDEGSAQLPPAIDAPDAETRQTQPGHTETDAETRNERAQPRTSRRKKHRTSKQTPASVHGDTPVEANPAPSEPPGPDVEAGTGTHAIADGTQDAHGACLLDAAALEAQILATDAAPPCNANEPTAAAPAAVACDTTRTATEPAMSLVVPPADRSAAASATVEPETAQTPVPAYPPAFRITWERIVGICNGELAKRRGQSSHPGSLGLLCSAVSTLGPSPAANGHYTWGQLMDMRGAHPTFEHMHKAVHQLATELSECYAPYVPRSMLYQWLLKKVSAFKWNNAAPLTPLLELVRDRPPIPSSSSRLFDGPRAEAIKRREYHHIGLVCRPLSPYFGRENERRGTGGYYHGGDEPAPWSTERAALSYAAYMRAAQRDEKIAPGGAVAFANGVCVALDRLNASAATLNLPRIAGVGAILDTVTSVRNAYKQATHTDNGPLDEAVARTRICAKWDTSPHVTRLLSVLAKQRSNGAARELVINDSDEWSTVLQSLKADIGRDLAFLCHCEVFYSILHGHTKQATALSIASTRLHVDGDPRQPLLEDRFTQQTHEIWDAEAATAHGNITAPQLRAAAIARCSRALTELDKVPVTVVASMAHEFKQCIVPSSTIDTAPAIRAWKRLRALRVAYRQAIDASIISAEDVRVLVLNPSTVPLAAALRGATGQIAAIINSEVARILDR